MNTENFEAIHAINRPHAPDEATADFIFKAYMLLKNAPPTFSKWARQGAFENIAACAVSWRVVGISEDALRKIAATGKRGDLQRGHWFARDKRYEALFGVSGPTMERDALIRFFFDHDTTVVITKEQNNADGGPTTWGKIVAVPEGMFTTSGYSFNVRKRTEIPWVAAAVAELDQG
ncbi:hypothetical protein [Variovorax sp. OV700]|uniref:hypothetical protein n=1 Tax=Variovorax sp. OV700 TaxID=1882826 RepID=UPI000891F505|nr:hypothetical protein [Variovorax sp. OV700]SDI08068.1 hypothetical protein SAMN05444748_103519 [Variovorax sp. OV700]